MRPWAWVLIFASPLGGQFCGGLPGDEAFAPGVRRLDAREFAGYVDRERMGWLASGFPLGVPQGRYEMEILVDENRRPADIRFLAGPVEGRTAVEERIRDLRFSSEIPVPTVGRMCWNLEFHDIGASPEPSQTPRPDDPAIGISFPAKMSPPGPGEKQGVYVGQVLEGGPAQLAGVQQGDIVTHVDGRPIQNADRFPAMIRSRPVGALVTLTIDRNGESLEISVETRRHADLAPSR